jgi:Cu-Zn family superoxide dismutase
MSFKKKMAPLLVALVATLGLAACGGGDSGGEDTVAGTFEVLPEASTGYDNLSGEAELTRGDGETTTAISLDGLEPDTAYMAHLHTGSCAGSDPGGPHFKFDLHGSDQPPNEIHLSFTSSGDGSGDAEVSSDQEVPVGEAGSVVLHLADEHHESASAGHQQFASLFVHEGEDHGGEAEEDHGSTDEPGHDGGGVQQLPDKIACAELEGGDGAEDGGEETASVPTIVVENGEPVGGIEELEYSAGEQIRFKVTGDEAEEIHVHGYDLMEDIPAGGGTVEFDFPAEIEGIFEGELEGQGTQILELRVNP